MLRTQVVAAALRAVLPLGAMPVAWALRGPAATGVVNTSSFAALHGACERGEDCFVKMGDGMFCPSGLHGKFVHSEAECMAECAGSHHCTGFAVGYCSDAKGPELRCTLYKGPCTFGAYPEVCQHFIGSGYAKGGLGKGVCTLVEDPHITVFDGAQVSLLREGVAVARGHEAPGVKWLVQSGPVHIQARYLPDPTLSGENMYVEAVAVGGPFLRNNTLVVGSLQAGVTWNGVPILESMPSTFEAADLVRATRHRASSVVQDPSQPGPGINVELPLGVRLVLNRFKHHVNVAIEMPQLQGGQDGLCGNFNGIAADDALAVAVLRRDPDVVASQSLFASAV